MLCTTGGFRWRRWLTACQLPVRCLPASGGPATRCLRRRCGFVAIYASTPSLLL